MLVLYTRNIDRNFAAEDVYKRQEYTQRAFLNGKMDLSQAEAVADLIASSSAATHQMCIRDRYLCIHS